MLVLTQDATKAKLLGFIKQRVHATAQQLASDSEVSLPAVRKHLNDLLAADLVVASIERPAGRGRPQHVYALSQRGEAAFPKTYAGLCVEILRHLEDLYSRQAVMAVLQARDRRRQQEWAPRIGAGQVGERLEALQAVLEEAGYQPAVRQEGGQLYLEQSNCPNLQVAREYRELCHLERDLYRSLLGTEVEREEHLLCGGKCCRYRVG
jgi:predicted ArsR family transcriptional regulator